MPYEIYKKDNRYCVRNTETGESKGCSDTKAMAVKHMRALWAAEGGAKMGKKEMDMLVKEVVSRFDEEYPEQETPEEETQTQEPENKELEVKEDSMSYTPIYGATSYQELDDMHDAAQRAEEISELIYRFPTLASNIVSSPEVEDKEAAIRQLADELASRIQSARTKELEDFEKAISKRSDVSEADKKRAVAEYGSVTYADPKNKKYPVDTETHIRAAWSYINMPKNAAKYSSSEVAAIKRRIVSAWKRKIDKNGPPQAKKEWEYAVDALLLSVKESASGLFTDEDEKPSDDSTEDLMVWYDKEANRWMWLARYSNNFRDRDNPPEIISANSHRRFVELVDKGLAPMPEYWLWHVPQWKVGQATWVAYDEAGFAMAAGYFDKGREQVAEWLSKQPDFAASHGMPPHTIKRDPDDPSIIIEHETREISALPRAFAANLLTDVAAFTKEANMAIPEEKRKTLIESWGMPADVLEQIEQLNTTTAEKAVEAGLERKEQEDTVTEEVTETPAEETAETTPEEEVQEQQETPEVDPNDQPPTRKEVAEAVISFIEPYLKQIETLTEQVNQLNAKLAEDKLSEEERVKQTIKETPMASLAALLTQRAVGAEETQVDKRESLAKSHPKETEVENTPGGLPSFITSMLSAGK